MTRLGDFTPARVALERAGNSISTRDLLEFELAHARARDAVHLPLDTASLLVDLKQQGYDAVAVASAAPDRATYLRRPDLGRALEEASRPRIARLRGDYDAAFIAGDGLSALAVHRHALPLLAAVTPSLLRDGWKLAPVVVVEQARVAVGDEIGQLLGAALTAVLIGERPGLSSPDSLGVYLTWNPRLGRTEAERNCISNIRAEGLTYDAAARKILFLMTEARRRKLTGFALKESADLLPPPG